MRDSHGALSAVGSFLALSLAVAACGSSTGTGERVLNTAKIERAIEHASLLQRGKTVTVTCPPTVQQHKGVVFFCEAVYRGGRTSFMVTELNAFGDVHYVAR
jgi:hypothetical protein